MCAVTVLGNGEWILQQKVSLYQQIYDTVTSEIIAGRLKPGDQAPSESQLMEQFGVSRITAKRALDEMENSGFIERRRGAGNFVLEQ